MTPVLKEILRPIRRLVVYIIRSSGVFISGLYCILITLMRGDRFKLKNHTDEYIVLLGNGPSLSNIDLYEIAQSYNLACVNWFATKDRSRFFALKPKYYFLLDPAFFGVGLEGRTKEAVTKIKADTEELKNIFSAIDWNMDIITPQRFTLGISNKQINTEQIATSSLCSDYMKKYQYFLYRHNLACCGIQNVLCGALHYFIVNNFRTVYLCGADMDEFKAYSIDEHNHAICTFSHFYGKHTIDCAEIGRIPVGDFYKHLGYYATMLKQFHYLRKFADYQGVRVINLSLNSYIDSFDKLEWKKGK